MDWEGGLALQFLDFAPTASLIVDDQRVIVFANLRAEKLFCLSKTMMIGEMVDTLLPDSRSSLFHSDSPQLFCGSRDGTGFLLEIESRRVQTDRGDHTILHLRPACDTVLDPLRGLASSIETSPDSILMTTLDGTIAAWNASCERLFGYTKCEAIGKPFSMLFISEETRVEQTILERIAQGEAVSLSEVTSVNKDGNRSWVSVSASPQFEPSGRAVGATLISRQVTPAMHPKLADEWFRGLLEAIPDSIVIVDKEGRIIMVNAQAERFLGYERAAMLNQTVEMLIPHRFRTHHSSHRQQFFQSPSVRPMGAGRQLYVLCANGSEIPVDISLSPLKTKDELWVIASIRNMTFRVDTAQKLEAVCHAAQAATRAKNLFLANMSHELRTPLNAVLGMVQLLSDSPLSPEQREYVATLKISGEHLLSLISDVLDLSKIEANQLVLLPEPADVVEIAKEALEIVHGQATHRGITVSLHFTPGIPRVMVDPARFRQILLNYLTNAIKFTDEGEIKLALDWKDLGDGVVELRASVSDTGIGIHPSCQQHLFKPFSQLHTGTSRGGVGLGLSICRHLTEAMGGRVWVESVVGVGSTFHSTLVVPVAEGRLTDESDGASLQGFSALVVGEQPSSLLCLQRLLESWGMKVARSDQAAALEAIDSTHVDIVILDEPAGMKGLIERLRAERPALELPVIILSSLDALPETEAGSIQGIISKPIRNRSFHAAMVHTLGIRKSRGSFFSRVAPQRILVAEDNRINQKVVGMMLSRLGQKAEIVANGEEAVNSASTGEFDLIFMDVNMPVMNGIEATRAIRQKLGSSHPMIVAMTADATAETRKNCFEGGMDGCILKPFRMEELAAAIEKASANAEKR